MPADYDVRNFSSVALGSKIYVFGGGDVISKESKKVKPLDRAMVYDTDSKSEWVDLPEIICPKVSPSLVTIDGVIYVMGCRNNSYKDYPFWCEMYFPEEKAWYPSMYFAPLERPNRYLTFAPACCAVLQEQKIIIARLWPHDETYLVHHNRRKSKKKWRLLKDELPEELLSCLHTESMVAVNNVIYMYTKGAFYVYDMSPHLLKKGRPASRKPAVSPVKGLEDYTPSMPAISATHKLFLLHVGGNDFCCLWNPDYGIPDSAVPVPHIYEYCQFHRLGFRIDRIALSEDKWEWKASVHAEEVYILPDKSFLGQCVQVIHDSA